MLSLLFSMSLLSFLLSVICFLHSLSFYLSHSILSLFLDLPFFLLLSLSAFFIPVSFLCFFFLSFLVFLLSSLYLLPPLSSISHYSFSISLARQEQDADGRTNKWKPHSKSAARGDNAQGNEVGAYTRKRWLRI